MKIPSGTPLIRNEPIKNGDLSHLLQVLSSHPLNGYMAITGMGYDGMEEGIFLLENNNITHAYYIHLKYIYEERGKSSLPYILNVFRAKGANADLVEFTIPKLKLTASFNEDCKLDKPIPVSSLPKLIPKAYDKNLITKIIRLRPAEELNGIKSLIRIGLGFGRLEDIG
jgi:hypothetical protein